MIFSGFSERNTGFIRILIIILLIPALLINLGLLPFILDEATRALVALEMIISGNYIVPTINGEFYYNKPPLFNWILVGFMKLTGSYNEIIFRLPVVLSLVGFAAVVYFTLKEELGKEIAFITAFALLTCGRIMYYDSFRGLIDISFSFIIYCLFWSVYFFGKRERYLSLFVVSWGFTSVAFLMKGLPALVFQAISLFIFFIYTGQFRRLFSWKNFAGGSVFLFITSCYFLYYHQFNSLRNYRDALWSESAKRTIIENPLMESLVHFFTFPGEFIMHFLPWTLLVFFVIGKGRLRRMLADPPVRFLILVLLANLSVYWLSPAIYPRYLFMFLPLVFGTGVYAWQSFGTGTAVDKYLWQPVMVIFGFITPLALMVFPFTPGSGYFNHLWIPWLAVFILSVILAWKIVIWRNQRVYLFIAALLLSRIAFNLFVLPDRFITSTFQRQKKGAITAGKITRGEELYIYKDTPVQHASSFYITSERKSILTRWYGDLQPGIFYILPLKEAREMKNIEIIHVFETRIENLKLCVINVLSDIP